MHNIVFVQARPLIGVGSIIGPTSISGCDRINTLVIAFLIRVNYR